MRVDFTIILLLCCAFAKSQISAIEGKVKNPLTNQVVAGAVVSCLKDTVVVNRTVTDTSGHFTFKNLGAGIYTLQVSWSGYRDEQQDSIVVKQDSVLFINIQFPPPCKQNKNDKPVCSIGGHKDHIIPIVYGMPDEKRMKKAKEGKIYLGGCTRYGCDPRFFCTIHNKQLL